MVAVELIAEKLLAYFLAPINESLELLQKIDTKLDIQASSRLFGAFDSLRQSQREEEMGQVQVTLALQAFTESSRYFSEFLSILEKELVAPPIGGIAVVFQLPVGVFGSGTWYGNKLALLGSQFLDCLTCLNIAQIGKILSMKALGYSQDKIDFEYRGLCTKTERYDKAIENRLALEIVDGGLRRGLIPKEIFTMNAGQLESKYGTLVPPEILEKNPWYKRVFIYFSQEYSNDRNQARQALTLPGDYTSYVFGKKPLQMVINSFLRYAELKTLVEGSSDVSGLMADLSQRFGSLEAV